jgi:excisionase family DNA binding protein
MYATQSPELLRIPQAAERLNVSRASVYRWIAEGRLPAVQLGGRGSPLRVSARELESWLYGPQEIDDVGGASSSHPHPARAPLASSAEVVDLRPPARPPEEAA